MIIWFDECVPPRWFRHLATMLAGRRSPIHGTHILDLFAQGMDDETLSEKLLQEPTRPLIISGDTGKRTTGKKPRLHLLCPAKSITSVFLSPSIAQREGFEKVRTVVYCLPDIVDAGKGVRGARYRIDPVGNGYKMREWPLPSPSASGPLSPQSPSVGSSTGSSPATSRSSDSQGAPAQPLPRS